MSRQDARTVLCNTVHFISACLWDVGQRTSNGAEQEMSIIDNEENPEDLGKTPGF